MPYSRLTFKVASEAEEFEQIHRLNYRTFVEEIPQHPPNEQKLLVDRFHEENIYPICLDGEQLVGMMALRSRRPFSLDDKVAGLDSYLPRGAAVCEFRLLAVDPDYRKPGVFARLLMFAISEGIKRGHDLAVASGAVHQSRLYSRMGFVPFAEPVGPEKARYQPMYLTFPTARQLFDRLGVPCPELPQPVSFMPGPVEISSAVLKAFSQPPVSHRAAPFLAMVADVKERLTALTGAAFVELFLGSGTLGNDVVAAQLKLLPGRGVVLSNGEFGDRLIDHAARMGLDFHLQRFAWGEPYDLLTVDRFLAKNPYTTWLWSVHCETSTGVLNDLAGLETLCQRLRVKLCLDCTSSLGTVPVKLRHVYLASSVSGKGLAALPGISLVCCNHPVATDPRLPRYLDLGYYREKEGTPFTHSSNLVGALRQALVDLQPEKRIENIYRLSGKLRQYLTTAGFEIMGSARHTSPAVISIVLPQQISSRSVGEAMERRGWLLSYLSGYLLERNIIQICLMGAVSEEQCLQMVEAFTEVAELTSVRTTEIKKAPLL
jgi:aspartate aminotransferase-like enzyme/GNAT superfamily N-acetyltransferase